MNNMNAAVTDPVRLEQHSLLRSVILHLLPGALIVTCYFIAAPQVVNLGFPPGLALLIGFVVVGIPLELGYLLYQGKKRNGTTAVLLVLVAGLVVDGIINPVVEELYFRGYLLPRISRLGWLAPFVSASLFTLAHFWQPYNYPIIFLIQLPLVYIVYWKRNIYIAILTHCAGNTIGALLSLVSFLGSA